MLCKYVNKMLIKKNERNTPQNTKVLCTKRPRSIQLGAEKIVDFYHWVYRHISSSYSLNTVVELNMSASIFSKNILTALSVFYNDGHLQLGKTVNII